MRNSSYQRASSSKFAKYFWHLLSASVIGFLVTSTLTAYIKNSRLENYICSINSEIASVKEDNIVLERQVNAILHDPVYRESVIRREMKLGLPGEMIIMPR